MPRDIILAADLGGTPLSAEELAAIPAFQGIRKEVWDTFPGAVARKEYRPGDILMREGESGTTAFYLLSGTVEIFISNPIFGVQAKKRARPKGFFRGFTKFTDYIRGIPQRERRPEEPARTHIPVDGPVDLPLDNPVAEVHAGEMLGELAALAALRQERVKRAKFYPRSATVRAKTDVTVLEMLPNILNNVLYTSPAFKDKLNFNYRERALASHLRSVPVFATLGDDFLDYLRTRVELVDVQPGQTICKQGEVADAFYLIRMGFVKVSQDFPGGELVLTYLSRGSYFGEMGLLPPAFRLQARGKEPGQVAEGAVAGEPLVCGRAPGQERSLAVPWDEFISREHFEVHVEAKKVRVTRLPAGKNPITYRMHPEDTFLLSPGDEFVIGNTTFELAEAPFQTGRRTATCTAVDYVQLVRIKAEDFSKMLGENEEVDAAVTEVARSRRQMDAQILNRVQTLSLNDFLNQELMQGQNLLLIDLDRCTRCDECVKACVSTHEDGVTRLIRDGLRFDRYLVPTSCRACLDPLCMTRCPVGSIRRKETLDIVIEDWCIGCSNCATDCPYGNINITLVQDLAGDKRQKAEPRPKAVVCDLCVDYDEPNCVRACPHDAAIRVEPKTFFARDLAGPTLAVAPAVSTMRQGPPAAGGEGPPPEYAETHIYSNSADLLNLMPRLHVISGARAGAILQLRYPATTFGRGAEADYRFQDDEKMSRLHCSIVCENSRFLVRDNDSTNGTLVNGNPVAELELRHGDVIEIGGLQLEFLTGSRS